MTTNQDWERLGRLLTARRIELGFPVRSKFADARNLTHSRTVSDIENAKRDNFEPATLALVEQLYEWAPGSIDAVLHGGEPSPLNSATRSTEDVTSAPDDARGHARRRLSEREHRGLGPGVGYLVPVGVDAYGNDLQAMRDELLAEHWNCLLYTSDAADE